jgi:hypothetical protein
MEMTSMNCKDGNGIKVKDFRFAFSETTNSLMMTVFSKDEVVFARTSPKHKLEIGKCDFQNPFLQFLISKKLVKRAQALGHIVGVYVEQS